MKKILFILLFVFIFSFVFCDEIAYNDQITGTSINTYVEKTVYTVRNIYKSIIVKNTGGSNSVDYYVRCYPYENGTAYYTFASGTLTHGSQADCFINNVYFKIVFGIKSTSSGNHSTYSIDYIRR